jgi:hypothetical protein
MTTDCCRTQPAHRSGLRVRGVDGGAMMPSEFIDGAWYIRVSADGRSGAHFFQRRLCGDQYARSSCGLYTLPISGLAPSHDTESDVANKINPRRRCSTCWRSECAKARRS